MQFNTIATNFYDINNQETFNFLYLITWISVNTKSDVIGSGNERACVYCYSH